MTQTQHSYVLVTNISETVNIQNKVIRDNIFFFLKIPNINSMQT